MADYDDLPQIVVERRSGSVASFLWGALIGAGVALLLAPRSGRETRDEIGRGVQRLKETADETMRQIREMVVDTMQDVRDEVTDRMETAREAMEAGRRAARETRESLEQRIRESRTAIEVGIEAARRRQASAEEFGAEVEDAALGREPAPEG